jgi:hypothetical protein
MIFCLLGKALLFVLETWLYSPLVYPNVKDSHFLLTATDCRSTYINRAQSYLVKLLESKWIFWYHVNHTVSIGKMLS